MYDPEKFVTYFIVNFRVFFTVSFTSKINVLWTEIYGQLLTSQIQPNINVILTCFFGQFITVKFNSWSISSALLPSVFRHRFNVFLTSIFGHVLTSKIPPNFNVFLTPIVSEVGQFQRFYYRWIFVKRTTFNRRQYLVMFWRQRSDQISTWFRPQLFDEAMHVCQN